MSFSGTGTMPGELGENVIAVEIWYNRVNLSGLSLADESGG